MVLFGVFAGGLVSFRPRHHKSRRGSRASGSVLAYSSSETGFFFVFFFACGKNEYFCVAELIRASGQAYLRSWSSSVLAGKHICAHEH